MRATEIPRVFPGQPPAAAARGAGGISAPPPEVNHPVPLRVRVAENGNPRGWGPEQSTPDQKAPRALDAKTCRVLKKPTVPLQASGPPRGNPPPAPALNSTVESTLRPVDCLARGGSRLQAASLAARVQRWHLPLPPAPEPTRLDERQNRMNAVERLLAQGEQLLSLYDEMYRERLGSGRDPALPDVPQGLIYAVGGTAIDAIPSGQYWASVDWLQAAAEAAWLQLKKLKTQPTREQLAARTVDLFREYLAQREQLLSDATWRRLLADVVFESRDWEPLSTKVVALAEQVCEAVKGVGLLDGEMEPHRWRHEEVSVKFKPLATTTSPARRTALRQALDLLHPYAQPPKPAGSSLEKKTGSNRSRGGRPQNDESLARELLASWKAFEPEEGRKTKDRYLAQRPEVQVLKTEDARQRKIASLLVALESAQHLQREKTKQRQRARG